MAALLSGAEATKGLYAGVLAVGLTFGLALALAIHIFGKISGGHYNPAVTTALLATRRIALNDALVYYVAQIAGAAVAALIQYILLEGMLITAKAGSASFSGAVIAEILGTFLLASVIFGVAVDGRAPSGWAPLMIGLAIPVGALALGPISGGSFNPAVSLGPRLVATLVGKEAVWGDMLIYIIGPLAGALLVVFLYDFVAQPRTVSAPVEKALNAEPTVGKGRK